MKSFILFLLGVILGVYGTKYYTKNIKRETLLDALECQYFRGQRDAINGIIKINENNEWIVLPFSDRDKATFIYGESEFGIMLKEADEKNLEL